MKIRLFFGVRICLRCPYFLVLNRLNALILSVFLMRRGLCIGFSNIYGVFRELRKNAKLYKETTVLSVITASGFELTVSL